MGGVRAHKGILTASLETNSVQQGTKRPVLAMTLPVERQRHRKKAKKAVAMGSGGGGTGSMSKSGSPSSLSSDSAAPVPAGPHAAPPPQGQEDVQPSSQGVDAQALKILIDVIRVKKHLAEGEEKEVLGKAMSLLTMEVSE